VPTEFHLAQCDLACCRFLRLFELEIGFEPSAAIPASLRPHLVRGHTICRARIYLGCHFSRYKGPSGIALLERIQPDAAGID
jgi:hypothetical protein